MNAPITQYTCGLHRKCYFYSIKDLNVPQLLFLRTMLDWLLFSACYAVQSICYQDAIKPKMSVNSLYSDSSKYMVPQRACSDIADLQAKWTPHGCLDHAEILYTYWTVTTQKHRNHPLICKVRRRKYTENLFWVTFLFHSPLANYRVPLLFVLHANSFTVTYRLVRTPTYLITSVLLQSNVRLKLELAWV